jgi:hypothetical protein
LLHRRQLSSRGLAKSMTPECNTLNLSSNRSLCVFHFNEFGLITCRA